MTERITFEYTGLQSESVRGLFVGRGPARSGDDRSLPLFFLLGLDLLGSPLDLHLGFFHLLLHDALLLQLLAIKYITLYCPDHCSLSVTLPTNMAVDSANQVYKNISCIVESYSNTVRSCTKEL